jgi:hypothetical protein
MPIAVNATSGMIPKDPSDTPVLWFDFTDFLANLVFPGAVISGTPVITITGDDAVLTSDSIVAVDADRQAQVRVLAGTPGALYRVACTIVSNTSPSETCERSVAVLVQDL